MPENNKPNTNGPIGVKNSSIFSDVFAELNSGVEIESGYICDYYTGNDDGEQFCVYATKVSNPLGEFVLMLVSSNEAVGEAVEVIQYQLILVTVGVAILSFLLSRSLTIPFAIRTYSEWQSAAFSKTALSVVSLNVS